LIRCRAKWDLYTNMIKNAEQAAAMDAAVNIAYSALPVRRCWPAELPWCGV
jgi:hypothetical protein